jgi:hypothetical protein
MEQRKRKITLWGLGGLALAAVLVGTAAFGFLLVKRAQAASLQSQVAFHGGPGFGPAGGADETNLAQALGITVQELQTAEQKAFDAAVQQALDKGLITQDQADRLILRGGGFGRGWMDGNLFGQNSGIDYQSLLAAQLNITTTALQSAEKQAYINQINQAVQNGSITQQQADLILGRYALQSVLDPTALFAQALGITTDQLQTYQNQGMSLSQILSTVGKTAVEVRDAEQAAYQAAVQQAVTNGTITQDQANAVLNSGEGFGLLPGGFGGREGYGGRGGHGRGGFGGGFVGGFGGGMWGPSGSPNSGQNANPNSTPNQTTPQTPSTTPGAGL